jgi:hypothetical protein
MWLLMAGQPGRFVHFACSGSIAHLSGAEIIPRILRVMSEYFRRGRPHLAGDGPIMARLGGRPVPLHTVQTTAVQVCAFPAQGAPKRQGDLRADAARLAANPEYQAEIRAVREELDACRSAVM